MDTTHQPLPHLALRAAKKLNPKLQCWRWNEGWSTPPGFFNRLDDYEGAWVPVGTPKWLPHCIYAVTGSKKEKPSWAPSPQQLKDASNLKRSTDAGKKPTCSTFPLDRQLEALGDERLIAAHDEAMAGLTAEKLLAHIKPIGNFHYVADLTTDLLFKRGLHHKRSWCE